MGIRRRLARFYYKIGLIVIIIFISCNIASKDHSKKDPYTTVEVTKLDGCSIYSMLFKKGDYIFRFALSGKCPTLTKELYLDHYTNFLKQYSDSLNYSQGKLIRLDFYKEMVMGQEIIEKIVLITKNETKKLISIHEVSDDDAILKIE